MSERITYYGTPEKIYDENVDFVKGTSLTADEVDMNFNTLEGRSIKNAELVGDTLKINFLDGNGITCCLAGVSAVRTIAFDYDREHGKLLVFINGHKPVVVDGFFSERDFRRFVDMGVLSDDTLVGNGTPRHPLSVSPMLRPGMHKSVDAYADELPEEAETGTRYVTAEKVDTYGALYNYKGVMSIMKSLDGGRWRVASKDDWDDMLNALEPEKADRNHHLHDCNMFLGESANHYLTDNRHNFNAVYCGYAYEEEELHVVFEGSRTCWWTSTHDDAKSAYIKRIDDLADGVFQDIIDGENYCSVRLVRDIMPGEVIGPENIMGTTYMTAVMPSMHKGLRLWTATNYASELAPETVERTETVTTTDCDGVTTTVTTTVNDIVDDMSDAVYRPEEYPESETLNFISEWNGGRWIKQRIDEYDAFYVKSLGGFYYLVGNEMLSMSDTTPIDLEQRVADLESSMSATTVLYNSLEGRITDTEEMVDSHSDTIVNMVDAISALEGSVAEFGQMATTAAGQATMAIDSMESMQAAIESLQRDVAYLKRFHGNDFVSMYLSDAKAYTYGDGYEYNGKIAVDGASVLYTLPYEEFAFDNDKMSDDLGRYIGAIYRASGLSTIRYKGTLYTWSPKGTDAGSNYTDESGNGLVSDMMAEFSEAQSSDWLFELSMEGVQVPFTAELT